MAVKFTQFIVAAAILSTSLSEPLKACDDLIGRLVRAKAEPALAQVSCGALGRAGVDNFEHDIKSICYTSDGPTSKISIEASLTCKTSDHAFIKVSLTGNATAMAEVRGADCHIMSFKLDPSGDLAQAINGAFHVQDKLQDALQKALDQACR